MRASRVEVRDLMERIRGRIRSTQPEPLPATERRPPLAASADLAHLNRHWVIEDSAPPGEPAPRRMLRAFVPRRLRRLVKGVLRDFVYAVLEPYLLEEREFLAHLVNLLNEATARIDVIENEARDLAARDDEARGRVLADLETLRLRAEQLHLAIERRLETAGRATAGGLRR